MRKSPIDNLFFELFDYYPKKAGQAFEIISAAAIKIITNKKVMLDQRAKGKYSDTSYQLDGEIISDDKKEMLEVKDYTINNRKVGRGDLQKLAGALNDLDIDKGIFASATSYTKPATKYANSTKINPIQKEIDLFHIRPATEYDEKGRIKKIIIDIRVATPNYDSGKYDYVWTDDAIKKFRENDLANRNLLMSLSEFYDKNGNVAMTLRDFTKNNQPEQKNFDDEIAKGAWNLSGYFIKYDNQFYELLEIKYEIPFEISNHKVVVENEGEPKILIKSSDGDVDILLTDKQFKELTIVSKEIQYSQK